MAVLSHDDLMALVNSKVSADNTDDDIRYLEDMTDTITALESNTSASELETLRNENAELRRKYTERFQSGAFVKVDEIVEDEPAAPLTFDALFKEE